MTTKTNWKKVIFKGRKQLAETIKSAWKQAQFTKEGCYRYRQSYLLEIMIYDEDNGHSEWEWETQEVHNLRACEWRDIDDCKLLTSLKVKDLINRPQFTDEEIKAMIDKWLKKYGSKSNKAA
jgi:hypothetical protein